MPEVYVTQQLVDDGMFSPELLGATVTTVEPAPFVAAPRPVYTFDDVEDESDES